MDVQLAALEAMLLAQAAKQTEMAARLESLKVRLQDHSALLRQLDHPGAPRDRAPWGDVVVDLREASSQISQSLSLMTNALQRMRRMEGAGSPAVYLGGHRILVETVRELLLICDSRDLQVTPALITRRVWEPEMTMVFERLIKPGGLVLEIGAHIGYFTTLAGSLTGGDGRVEAYEPNARSHELLCANLRLNRMAHFTRTHRQAVSATSGTAVMSAFTSNMASSTLSSLPDRLLDEFGETPSAVEVATVTLDEQYRGIRDRFDFVKIDAEGAEPLILRGGREFLTFAIKRDGVVAFEYNPPASQGLGEKPAAAIEQLSGAGFSVVQLMPDGALAAPQLDPWCNAALLARRGSWPATIHQLG